MGAAFEVEKKPDLSYFSPNDILPAEENQLLYDSFRPAADEDEQERFAIMTIDGEQSAVDAIKYILGERLNGQKIKTQQTAYKAACQADVAGTEEEEAKTVFTI